MQFRFLSRWLVLGGVVLAGSVSARAEVWRFAVLSDTHVGTSGKFLKRLTALAPALAAEDIDVLLVTGDLQDGLFGSRRSRLAAWREAMAPLYRAGVMVLPVRGNHDGGIEPAVWRSCFPEVPGNGPDGEKGLTFAFEHKSALFIGLDQYVRPHRVNQPWLDGVLARNRQPHVFVFGHEPAFAARRSGTLADRPAERDAFWSSLAAANVRRYFCGHDHFYGRSAIADHAGRVVEQIICGTGSAGMRGDSDYDDDRARAIACEDDDRGYVLVEVAGDVVTMGYRAVRDSDEMILADADEHRYDVGIDTRRRSSTRIFAAGTP